MKTRRHAKILELIQENAIDTQEELLRLLRVEMLDACIYALIREEAT